MPMIQTRRRFLTAAALAGAADLIRPPQTLAAEGPLETTTVRLLKPGLCVSTLYVAEELLRAEGFTDIRFVDRPDARAIGQIRRDGGDFGPIYACECVQAIDAGEQISVLAGVMVGCFELFARDGIGSVGELKGKRIGVQAAGPPAQQLLTLMAAEVGLDARDVQWVTDPKVKPIELFVGGKIDAFLGFPPEPQQLRAARIGHVLVNTAADRPWSQYFCCMLAGSPHYVRAYPNATRSVLRAVLKAADLCAADPPASGDASPTAVAFREQTMPLRRSRTTITSGESLIRRTRYGGTRCDCAKPVWSGRPRNRSSPTAPTGAF